MPSEYSQLRATVIEWLKSHLADQVYLHPAHSDLVAHCRRRGLAVDNADLAAIQQVFHELYLERIIVSGSGPQTLGDAAMGWPFYRVTEYGKKVLDATEYVPYDPDGYLARLEKEMPSIDRDAVRYLEEALGCFRSSFLLAAAVMVGCAAERVLLLLVEGFGQALADPNERQQYAKETSLWMIGRKYDALWKRLEPRLPRLPKPLADDLHVTLDRVFDLIRTTRNDAGHPAGKAIERETVHANLILFPIYCKRVYGLLGHLAGNQV